MKHLIPIVLVTLALPVNALAVICKSIDADGVVSYADVPAAECPEAVKLPDYSTYAPRPITPPQQPAVQAAAAEAKFAGYTSMAIVAPPANGTLRDNEGRVPVVIDLQPELQPGHQVALFLDARAVAGNFTGTAIELSGVERGTHSLRAQVKDAEGRVQIDSASILFTLRKRGLFDGPAQAENPVEPDPGVPNPGVPNPGKPGFTPNAGGISTTPGRTNPAFAPNYGR